jgi:UDP-glucose 4-epimerase
MKYLITGGCGFIGSHIAEKIILRGDEVFVIDDLSTGSIDNVKEIIDKKNFHLVIDTILNVNILEELIKKCDFVFHLAAVVGVKRVLENPVDSVIINVEGTYNVLRLCTHYNKKLLLTSTSEVYGKNDKVPFVEESDIVIGNTKKKRWSYACTKAIDEFLALAFFEEKKLPVIIVRLFNTVGPRQSDMYGMVIPRFIKQALNNLPITVFGDGEQTRCFIHVDDVSDAVLSLVEKEEAYGDVFNLGSKEEITIKALAEIIRSETKSSSKILFVNPETVYNKGFEDMNRRVPDTAKIEKVLGFSPRYKIKEIIRDILNSIQNS